MKRGFTLIELLVVIATISLLSSIVFASLNSARDKSKDAAMKANLSGMRVAAALIYDNTGTFDTICDSGTSTRNQLNAAYDQSTKGDAETICRSSGTNYVYSSSGSLTGGTKAVTPDKWAAVVQLRNNNYFCVDYSGIAREQGTRGIVSSTSDVDC